MRQARLVKFLAGEVEVKELTAAQVINLLRQADQAEPISIDLLMELPGAGDMLRASTGLSTEKLEEVFCFYPTAGTRVGRVQETVRMMPLRKER